LTKDTWYIYQLSRLGEEIADQHEIVLDIKDRVSEAEVFLTSEVFVVDKQVYSVAFLPGYIFVKNLEDLNQYSAVEESPYISSGILDYSGPSSVDQEYLWNVREQFLENEMNKVEIGQIVQISKGQWVGFKGVIVDIEIQKRVVTVMIEMDTIKTMIALPPYAIESW